MTAPQVRKGLKGLTKEKLTGLLEGMYKSCPDAANYLNIRLVGEAFEKAFLSEASEKVHDCFFTKRGKARLDLLAACSGCKGRKNSRYRSGWRVFRTSG